MVGTRPVRGGVFGLLAGSVVAGYWQLDPSVAGGLNVGSGMSDVGDPVGPGCSRFGRNGTPSHDVICTARTANTIMATTTSTVSTVSR